MMRVAVVSIVPSPYQRDLFYALSKLVELKVYYLESESPDSPWPKKELYSYEQILPGTCLNVKGFRFHINWQIPSFYQEDVIILNGYMGSLFQWLLRFRAKRYDFVFWGERTRNQSGGFTGVIKRWLSAPLKNCRAIVAIGPRAQMEYKGCYADLPVFDIPYHCDLSSFQRLPIRDSKKGMHFLFCGQMILRKGLDILLLAFERLIATYDATLHLVGREAELPLMLSMISPTCRSKIIYHGFQSPEKLYLYFDMADVFVLPSRYDGWGVVINQALGAGLPVICSDQVGASSLVKENVNGHIFKSGDVNDLFRVMSDIAKYPENISKMSINSRERSSLITPERGAEKWLGVIKEIKSAIE